MSISQKLELKQSQNLIMTPQLREAISLLQLSNVELGDYLDKELAQNPLLEKDEGKGQEKAQDSLSGEAGHDGNESGSNNSEDSALDSVGDDSMDAAFAQSQEQSWEGEQPATPSTANNEIGEGEGFDYSQRSSFEGVGAGGNSKFEHSDYSFEDHLKDEKSLREHLIEQLHLKTDDQRERMVGAMMIDYLDESGYLRLSHEELAEKIGCSLERVEKLLGFMRQFDPSGIFARDLPDCLGIQLKDINRFDPAIEKLLQNLEMLAEGDHKGLAKICGVDLEDVQDMVADIRSLNPRPASLFDHVVVQTALPDVIMQPLPRHVGGGWKVALNQDTLPRILVNREYHAIISRGTDDKKDKKYLNDQLASASWLVKALDQRAQTVLKVATEIVDQQDGFFLYGVEFLKPLTLKDIAEEVGVHESTVSRVTMNKYIGTPRGLFELKYFFDSGVSGAGGGEHAAEAVKARIKALIDAEDVSKILSDDGLAALLKKEGIDIARRTVAKYREAMHIPSSVMRRRQKKNAKQ